MHKLIDNVKYFYYIYIILHNKKYENMAIKIAITQDEYETLKLRILEQDTIKRVDVSLADIEIESLKLIKVQGVTLNLTDSAKTGLASALGVTSLTMDTLNKAYKDNQVILNLIIKAIKSSRVKALTLVYNRKLNELTNVYPVGSKLIQDSEYFNILEKVITNTPGSYLRNIVQTAEGDLSAVIANPNLEFQFGNIAQETFISGMTLDLTSHKMWTSFFTERLWCTNGATIKDKLCSVTVNVASGVPDFLAAILDSDYHINSIAEFRKRLNRCYHTTASLNEVLETEHKVKNLLGSSAELLCKDLSGARLRHQFGEKYLANTDIHKFLKTDMTLWDLVNEVTAISSHIEQNKEVIPTSINLKLQIIGGDRMFRIPDLAPNNIKQIF